MKGRNEFTKAEIDSIRALLTDKQTTSRGRQKQIRTQLARTGFYVSDFAGRPDHPFGPADLDRLIDRGRVTVVDPPKRSQAKRGGGTRRRWWVRALSRLSRKAA
jgi:hypothetical protein